MNKKKFHFQGSRTYVNSTIVLPKQSARQSPRVTPQKTSKATSNDSNSSATKKNRTSNARAANSNTPNSTKTKPASSQKKSEASLNKQATEPIIKVPPSETSNVPTVKAPVPPQEEVQLSVPKILNTPKIAVVTSPIKNFPAKLLETSITNEDRPLKTDTTLPSVITPDDPEDNTKVIEVLSKNVSEAFFSNDQLTTLKNLGLDLYLLPKGKKPSAAVGNSDLPASNDCTSANMRPTTSTSKNLTGKIKGNTKRNQYQNANNPGFFRQLKDVSRSKL